MKNFALNLLNVTSPQDLPRLYEQALKEPWTSPHLPALMDKINQAGPDGKHSRLALAFLPGYQAVLYLERLLEDNPDYLRSLLEDDETNRFLREVCLGRARIILAMKHTARIFSLKRRRALAACLTGISPNV